MPGITRRIVAQEGAAVLGTGRGPVLVGPHHQRSLQHARRSRSGIAAHVEDYGFGIVELAKELERSGLGLNAMKGGDLYICDRFFQKPAAFGAGRG